MNVLIPTDDRFVITNDGTFWAQIAAHGYPFWARYLDVYAEVRLCSRALPCAVPPDGWVQASGERVKAVPMPYYHGPAEFARNYFQVRQATAAALQGGDAIILRVSSNIARGFWQLLDSRRPYGVEVINDPYDVFAPGSVRHPLRPLFRWWFPRTLRQQCMRACAALYVTREALQRRYPCPNFSTHASNVYLPEEAIVTHSRSASGAGGRVRLVFVGTLAQMYKAPDILIDAVGKCVRDGLDLSLVLVGDGKHRAELQARAAAQGLHERVTFRGQLSGSEQVRMELDAADLFVLPSYQEGLPRAMIEAMARGLPCIGSTVGGIPELLPPEDLVAPGNSALLADKIWEITTDPPRMAAMSARNLHTAREYAYATLRKRRIAFYSEVCKQTETWASQRL